MRISLFLFVVLTLPACQSLDRLLRNSPMSGEPASELDRVNVWPVYYQDGEHIAVLWPIFDQDENGFALRPLITKDGNYWELLPPIAWWDTSDGDWVFLPAYSVGNSSGVFPIAGFGEFNYVGPVWWTAGDEHRAGSGGLFPLVDIGHDFNNIGPVFWGHDQDGEMDHFFAFPFYGYDVGEDGATRHFTLLGGKGVDADGELDFLNVLGPVYHYHRSGSGESTAVLWPIYNRFDGERRKMWSVWPLVRDERWFGEEGEPTAIESTYLAGLVQTRGLEETEALRVLPLFSYRSEEGGGSNLNDLLTLYAYHDHGEAGFSTHIGTPLLFNYHDRADGAYDWNSLLGAIQYSDTAEASEFRLLWYLYRQRSTDGVTERDFFPFVSWDSGEERSRFSFLWRIFNWERNGDKTGGHVLFIPWGDTGGGD